MNERIDSKAKGRSSTARPFLAETLEPRMFLSASLLKDINTTGLGSSPQELTDVNGTLFFSADGPLGRELWKTDGTPGGAMMVKDIVPGARGSFPIELTNVNGTLYFTLDSLQGDNGELWKSDGTAEGTFQVTALKPDPSPAFVQNLNAFNDHVFFSAAIPGDPNGRLGLFQSDGTDVGTTLVRQLQVFGSSDVEMVPFRDKLFYSPTAFGAPGEGLFKTDGTPAGTVRVGGNLGTVYSLAVAGDWLFFLASGSLWKTDGTSTGTFRISDPRSVTPRGGVTPAGDSVFFQAYDNEHGDELWTSDGMADGTRLVKDINLGPRGSSSGTSTDPRTGYLSFDAIAAFNGNLLFAATDGEGVRSLWKSDGTEAGTTVVKSAATTGAPLRFAQSGGKFYFVSGGVNAGIWTSDGTETGTVKLCALGNARTELAPYRDGVVFANAIAGPNVEPWFSDGTPAGTGPLDDINHQTGGSVHYYQSPRPVSLNSRLLFTSISNADRLSPDPNSSTPFDMDLWSTDGTPEGTFRVSDFALGEVSRIDSLIVHDGAAYMLATVDGRQGLWRSDGTPNGTAEVTEVEYARKFFPTSPLVEAGGSLYFTGSLPSDPSGFGILKTDGTADGTVWVKNFQSADFIHSPTTLTAFDGALCFTIHSSLWRSDGTDVGTMLVKEISSSEFAHIQLIATGPTLFLRISDNSPGQDKLWSSDGTSDGTTLVRDDFGAFSGNDAISTINGKVVFAEAEGLWVSDGTLKGTLLLSYDRLSSYASPDPLFVAGDGVLYFTLQTHSGLAEELWKTDGTPGGTVKVADLNNGQPGYFTKPLAYADGRLYFADSDGVSGSELWRLDVASGGIEQVADVAPGADGSSPLFAAPINGRLVFWANDQIHGYEPWATSLAELPNQVVGRALFYNDSKYDGHDPAATDADLAAIAPVGPRLSGDPADSRSVGNYSKGINGLLVEFANPPALPLTADDFVFQAGRDGDPADWSLAPAPAAVAPVAMPVDSVSSHFAVVWPDGAIKNTWLRVTIKANTRTRLSADDVFFFGNLVGETGYSETPTVNAADLVRTRNAVGLAAAIDSPFDFNRDGVVNAADLVLVRNNIGMTLAVPSLGAFRVGFSPIPIRRPEREDLSN